ncbi:MAG TPA: MFS transporter [Ktedonobacterales bacterium]|jgi:MFS family permease|nr:MFS transporter [Ktedonobacterales bacterium]
MSSVGTPTTTRKRDFWTFFTGQTFSNLGTSFTLFALPLLVYQLTKSPLNLAIATAADMLPYLLFGLLIGAWVDRVDRKRLMIVTDLTRAAVIASIPLMYSLGHLTVVWIYGVAFVHATLGIFFNSAEFAAIPSLVSQDDLVAANGRIQASYSAAQVMGPVLAGALLAGAMVARMPVPALMLFDAASFLLSVFSLTLIRTSFNQAETTGERKHILRDVVDGLRYVLRHPVLRNISAMMALVNFVGVTVNAQLVLFATKQLHASYAQVAWLYSAGSAGVVVMGLLAGFFRKRWSFSQVALGALMVNGLLTLAFALTPIYWVGLVLWGLTGGLGILFNINTGSLRQAIVPNHLLGRVISIASVLAWSAIPLGSLLGGYALQQTQNVVLVYAVIGVLTFLIPLLFSFTALGHAERYLPKPEQAVVEEAAPAVP